MPSLGVNIDHVATLRQARYRGSAAHPVGEPDPVRAAHEAELGGAEIITVHLREDRRHVGDRDVERLREGLSAGVRINLEMAATEEMVAVALRLRPGMVTLVPEARQEVTTEGGLDCRAGASRLRDVVARLSAQGIVTSAFIDADPAQVDGARAAGFLACELHTGPFADEFARCGGDVLVGTLGERYRRLIEAGHRVRALGMRFNAGHGLNYQNIRPVAVLPGLAELHIGHAIIARSVYTGLRSATAEMRRLIDLCAGGSLGGWT